MYNRMGCCALTDVELFEVVKRHIKGPREGEPSELGPPLDSAWRVTLVLLDGSQMDVSLCEDVLPDLESRFRELWANIMRAFVIERSERKLTPKQIEQQNRNLATLETNLPIGILEMVRWKDLVNG